MLVDTALERSRELIAERRIEVKTELGAVRVSGSETLLARMVENVIENAVWHNERRGWITVASTVHGAGARLVVESGGSRLEERAVAQLAQPFRRLTAERTGSEAGVGLGLSIVAAVAAAHGGALELHARSGGGLRVQIDLPGATAALPATVTV